ncbi:MAG: response regulator [Bacteriovoracaceae bacterium]|nr:response regulator [Bacteriovoracaceae bacterium]
MRVLVVDDHEDFRDMVSHFLKGLKIKIVQCASGNEAIEELKNGVQFDLIISDYQMPEGDGLEVLKFLASNKIQSKFILFTSYEGLQLPVQYDHFLGIISKYEFSKLSSLIIDIKAGCHATN